MNAYVPEDWKEVEHSQFDEFLKTCHDYKTDGFTNGIVYFFRRNNQRFAIALDAGPVLVDPKLLK